MRLVVGISGSSGVIYGIRLLEVLREQADVSTQLILSRAAKLNISIETEWKLKDVEALADAVLDVNDLTASVSSGSHPVDGMVVAPCSMKTLSAIVNSYADNLLVRAADVMLKERRKLVLMPRESPLHVGHCRLLYEAAKMGVDIAPPMPAFYNNPQSVDDIVNHSVGRVLDLFHLDAKIVERWTGAKTDSVA